MPRLRRLAYTVAVVFNVALVALLVYGAIGDR